MALIFGILCVVAWLVSWIFWGVTVSVVFFPGNGNSIFHLGRLHVSDVQQPHQCSGKNSYVDWIHHWLSFRAAVCNSRPGFHGLVLYSDSLHGNSDFSWSWFGFCNKLHQQPSGMGIWQSWNYVHRSVLLQSLSVALGRCWLLPRLLLLAEWCLGRCLHHWHAGSYHDLQVVHPLHPLHDDVHSPHYSAALESVPSSGGCSELPAGCEWKWWWSRLKIEKRGYIEFRRYSPFERILKSNERGN